jgi:hypothetical protein
VSYASTLSIHATRTELAAYLHHGRELPEVFPDGDGWWAYYATDECPVTPEHVARRKPAVTPKGCLWIGSRHEDANGNGRVDPGEKIRFRLDSFEPRPGVRPSLTEEEVYAAVLLVQPGQ